MGLSEVEWELDSDEIASATSEDLHNNRPNRWTSPKSTWRELTQEERRLWQAMRQLQDQDLAAHLYNAFALRRRGKDPDTKQDLVIKTDTGEEVIWAPPKIWTAWPLKERHLPDEGLIQRQRDEDDIFTFRKDDDEDERMPGSTLQEEVSALILRLAKEKFERRAKRSERNAIEIPSRAVGNRDDSPESEILGSQKSTGAESGEGVAQWEVDWDDPKKGLPTQEIMLAVVSADDQESQKLLRLPVRHILSQLDKTLTILHYSRAAGLGYVSESSTEEESDSLSSQNRRRGRLHEAGLVGQDPASPEARKDTKRSRRGRPRKAHIPREGETEEEMQLRIARESHRRLPRRSAEEDAKFERWLREGKGGAEPEPSSSTSRPQSQDIGSEGPKTVHAEETLARWGLRDWSSVVGAAALAGFPSEVIARTTRRCADLFGEAMVIRGLEEVPASRGTGTRSFEYRPEPIHLPGSDEDTDEESVAEQPLPRRRRGSRQASVSRSSRHSTPSASTRGRKWRHGTGSPSRSRSRSLSSGAPFFCPVTSCDRAANGFNRKANLRRHVELVHHDYEGQTDDVDSADEVVGAVHTDGFLKPIMTRRGWRGVDRTTRKRKRFYGSREVSRTRLRATRSESGEPLE